jgi:hypothetical protein
VRVNVVLPFKALNLESPHERRDFSSYRVEGRLRMRGQRYRMKTPTLAIMIDDGHKIPITVPRGGEIEVVGGPLDGDRLLDVRWEGKPVMMFTTDIRERGERVGADGQ